MDNPAQKQPLPSSSSLAYDTLAVHTGIARGTGVGVGIPIQQMAAFQFDSLQAAAEEFQTNAGSSLFTHPEPYR